MKITPHLNLQAPELCYFTVNGFRFPRTIKGLGLDHVDWYKLMTDKKAGNPVATIRKTYFKPIRTGKFATIKIEYTDPAFTYLNKQYTGYIRDYGQLKAFMLSITEKHPTLNNDKQIKLNDGSLMPRCNSTIKVRLIG